MVEFVRAFPLTIVNFLQIIRCDSDFSALNFSRIFYAFKRELSESQSATAFKAVSATKLDLIYLGPHKSAFIGRQKILTSERK